MIILPAHIMFNLNGHATLSRLLYFCDINMNEHDKFTIVMEMLIWFNAARYATEL